MKYSVYNHHNFWQRPEATGEPMDSEVVFMWADWPFVQAVRNIQALGKKVVTYEHGFGALHDYELNKRVPCSNGYLALGEESKESLIRVGVDKDKILVAGNPVYDDVKRTKHKGKKALYVAMHWVRDMAGYNQAVYDQLVKAYPEFDWTAKLIDKSGDITADKKWFNNVESDTILQDIKSKLPEFDMVFTPRYSTFASFATLMGIPVYIVDQEESYKLSGDPSRMDMDYTFLKIGDKLPEVKDIQMEKHIKRPSLDMDKILEWVREL